MPEHTNSDVEAFEKTAEYKKSQALRSENEPSQFPSVRDESGRTDLPEHDETLSDAEDPSRPLHGSLHGNWSAPNDAE
jgi:hypothetical protein